MAVAAHTCADHRTCPIGCLQLYALRAGVYSLAGVAAVDRLSGNRCAACH